MKHPLVQWMDRNTDVVAEALPQGWTHAQAQRSALALMQADKANDGKLQKCDPGSLLLCVLQAASLGLTFDAHEAYVIPYGGTATLSIGYRGLIKLAKTSGEVRHMRAEVVHAGEPFTSRMSSDPTRRGIDHGINIPRSGDIVAVYVVIDRADGLTDFEVMDRSEIDGVKKASEDKMRGSTSPAWRNWFGEMAKKAVIRRALKRYTLQPEIHEIFAREDAPILDVGSAVVAETSTTALGLNPAKALTSDPAPAAEPAKPARKRRSRAKKDDKPKDTPAEPHALDALLDGVEGAAAFRAKFDGLDEAAQADWLHALKDAEPADRAGMIAP